MTALIVIAVIVIIIALILSVSATFTITYTDKWKTTISVLWFEKDIELTKILDFILFPQNKANQIKAQKGSGKENKKPEEQKKNQEQRLLSIKTKMFRSLFRQTKAKPLPLLQNSRKAVMLQRSRKKKSPIISKISGTKTVLWV